MTRDEAIKLWRETLHPENGPKWSPERWAEKAIETYVALGMLKLDEPKSAREKFKEAFASRGYHADSMGMSEALAAFDASQK